MVNRDKYEGMEAEIIRLRAELDKRAKTAVWVGGVTGDAVPAVPVGSTRIGPNGPEVYLGPMVKGDPTIDSPNDDGATLFDLVQKVIRKRLEQTGERPASIAMPADQRRRMGEWLGHGHLDGIGWDPLAVFYVDGVLIEAVDPIIPPGHSVLDEPGTLPQLGGTIPPGPEPSKESATNGDTASTS